MIKKNFIETISKFEGIITIFYEDETQLFTHTYCTFDFFSDDLFYYFSEKDSEDYNYRINKEKIVNIICCDDSVTIYLENKKRIIITIEVE